MTRMRVWMVAALVVGAWAGAAARGQIDGSIVAWGQNGAGQCFVPAPNSGFVSVAAGGYHALGMKADSPPCPADVDGDGFVTGDDFTLFVEWFEVGDLRADFDGDGFLSGDDFTAFVSAFEAGC